MIRLALFLCVLASSAFAQVCATQAPGTNNTTCASTAFVQNAVGGSTGAITSLTGPVTASGPGAAATTIAAAAIANANLVNEAANTWKGNATSASATPADNAWTNCNGANSAVNYTNGTGTGCNSSVAALGTPDQTLAGGANVTSLSVATGNVTIDCGARPLQFQTNGGAFTITAPANDGSCILLSTNNASAGTITFSGFSVGSSTGDTLTTANGSKFSIFIWRVNSVSGFRVAAHQ
jgi:hypothetical protein